MYKLTQKDDQGNWCLKGVPWENLNVGKIITKEVSEKLYGALWKLMEYEDTNLSPEDVERVNSFDESQAIKAISDIILELNIAEVLDNRGYPCGEGNCEPVRLVLDEVLSKFNI